jgi:hypothetical protein
MPSIIPRVLVLASATSGLFLAASLIFCWAS